MTTEREEARPSRSADEQTYIYARELRQLYEAERSARQELERLYAAVQRQEQRLQALVTRLLTAQEEERRRMAYDIHDGLAQMLVGAYQHLQASEKLQPSRRHDRHRVGEHGRTGGTPWRRLSDREPARPGNPCIGATSHSIIRRVV